MNRETYGFRRFAVVPDAEPDAESLIYSLHCAVCGQSGPAIEAAKENTAEAQEKTAYEAQKEAASWVARHRKDEPEHFTYRLWAGIPYRLEPGAWQ